MQSVLGSLTNQMESLSKLQYTDVQKMHQAIEELRSHVAEQLDSLPEPAAPAAPQVQRIAVPTVPPELVRLIGPNYLVYSDTFGPTVLQVNVWRLAAGTAEGVGNLCSRCAHSWGT